VIRAIVLCLLGLCALPQGALATSPVAAATGVEASWQQVVAAESRRKQGDAAGAWKLLQSVLQSPWFELFPAPQQQATYVEAALAAIDLQRPLDAQTLAVRAAQLPTADAGAWVFRAAVSAYVADWVDVAGSLARVARQWPAQAADFEPEIVFAALGELRRSPRESEGLFELLEALYAAKWVPSNQSSVDWIRFELLKMRLDRGDTGGAREIVAQIQEPRILIQLRTDQRFDAIIQFDDAAVRVAAAAKRQIDFTRDLMRKHPDLLSVTLRHISALRTGLRLRDALSVADATIARIQRDARRGKASYVDLDDQQAWLLDLRSRTLATLGEFDAALRQMQAAKSQGAEDGDRVSQAINLAFLYVAAERPTEALAAVEQIDWGKGISDYGRFQLQAARAAALQMLGRAAEATAAMEWMAAHRDVSPETHTWILLRSGDLDAAAASLIARLDDPRQRAEVLEELQDYPALFETAYDKEVTVRFSTVRSRPDVQAAIARYGRIERFNVLSPSAW
jgi:hypothetical protein